MSYDLTNTERAALLELLELEPASVGAVHEVPGLFGTGARESGAEGSPVFVSWRDVRAEGGRELGEVEGWEILGSLSEIQEAAGLLLNLDAGESAPGEVDPVLCLEILTAAGLANGERVDAGAIRGGRHGWKVDAGGRLLERVRMIRAGRAGWRVTGWRSVATVARRADGAVWTTWSLDTWEDLPKAFEAPRLELERLLAKHARHLLEPVGAAAIIERHESGAASSAASAAARELTRAGYRAFQALPHELTRSSERSSDRDMTRRAVAVLLEDAEIRAAVLEALPTGDLWDVLNERGEG